MSEVHVLLWQAADSMKAASDVVRSVTGKSGAWFDVPLAWALLGVLAHLYAKWGDKRRFVKDLTFWGYVSYPQRMKMHVLTFAIIGAWTANVGLAGYNFRDAVPYHWVTGMLLGYFTDSILKLAIKQVPVIGTLVGARRDSAGDITLGPSHSMPAVPPPPGFGDKPEGSP